MTDKIMDPMQTKPFQVERVRRETRDTFTLEMRPVKEENGLAFAAGQFNMLYAYGIGEIPISISGDPETPERLVHTVRAVGAVSAALPKLKRGQVLGVRGPYGTHWPVEEAYGRDVLIVTGGIGLAPLRPALYQLMAHREKYGKVILLYGARTPEEILYQSELAQWRARPDLEVHVTVDRGTGDWRGNVGVVTTLIPKVSFEASSTVAFACGPEIMMRFTLLDLRRRNIAPNNTFISMERNMKCGVGFCGHCQFGAAFVCKDGPVFRFDRVKNLFEKWEI
jgi:NAD(P)H-flavin reductase